MKVFLVFAIIIICVTASINYTKRINNHIISVRQFLLMLENIKILIMYKNLSVEELFDYVLKSDTYDLLGFIETLNNNIKEHNQFYEIINDSLFSKTENYFDRQEVEDIKNFLLMLGNSDTEGQMLNCELYKNMFNKKLSILEQNKETQRKTGVSLIFGVGVVLIILII